MELNQYLETVRDQVAQASSLADEDTQHVVQRLSGSIDAALRLALIQALADAASEISADLAPGSVELRMHGPSPGFAVSLPPTTPGDELPNDTDDYDVETETDSEDAQARISLRLPQSLKARVDEIAAREGVSANSWIAGAVAFRLRREQVRNERRGNRRGGHRYRRGRGFPGRPPFPPGTGHPMFPDSGQSAEGAFGPPGFDQPGFDLPGFDRPGFDRRRGRACDDGDEGSASDRRFQGWVK